MSRVVGMVDYGILENVKGTVMTFLWKWEDPVMMIKVIR